MNKKIVFIIWVLSLALNVHATGSLIKAKAYLDVESGQWQSPAHIVIKDGMIEAINPDVMPEGVEVIDLSGQYLVPGLMDMHTHLDLDFNGGFDDIITKEGAAGGALRAAKNAEKTLMAGFTTVRNIGTVHITDELIDVALAEAIDKGWVVGPDVIPAGHMITILGGHGDLTLGLSENLIVQSPINGIVSGVDEAIKAVRYQIKNGAKVIKIHATAGVLSLEDSVGAQQLSNEEMKAIVDEAARHHIKVAAHAHGTAGIIAAIHAGVASIEHGSLLDKEGMRLMKKHGVYLVPTTGLIDSMSGSMDKIDPKMAAKAKYVLPLAQENLSKAIDQGVPIALGTDAPLIPHGQNALELSAMMNRGMSAAEAIRSATINTADLLGLKDRGQIKVGMRADIIAASEDALKNIKALESVGFVMKKGVVYKQ
ncbi:metal-dependent hydrolase family protein [Marinicella rhabdoformis]|uniref:metal-dependent hydrolase family protein n=1 Tax=Marinicella rhabdoformis TaxID=2580566 RepID=UPI0012AEDC09|nr:amidohydrolase family protein [Marinicella rhabdoformis]